MFVPVYKSEENTLEQNVYKNDPLFLSFFLVIISHFDFDTTSGKTDGKLLTGMKNHFDTAEFSS